MSTPTEGMVIGFLEGMQTLGEGEIVWAAGRNPYSSPSHPAHDQFEHDRKNWNVLGLVNIDEALQLDRWKKAEAALWVIGLSLPGGSRHNPEQGPFSFDEEGKRLFCNWVECFFRNTATEEASPREWIEYAKAKCGSQYAQLAMIGNPEFKELWEREVESVPPGFPGAPALDNEVSSSAKNDKPAGRRAQQFAAILAEIEKKNWQPMALKRGSKKAIKDTCCLAGGNLFTDSSFDHAWKKAVADGIVRMENHDMYAH